MKGQNLRQLYESLGPRQCCKLLGQNLKSGEFKTSDFSLRELAESFCGHNWVRRLHEGNFERRQLVTLEEAGEAVDVSAFSNITGQLIFTRILEGWEQPGFIADELFETIDSKLDGEKFPFLGRIKSEGEKVPPGKEYPETSFGERFIQTPSTDKYGMIVSITKEAIFFDRTAQMLQRAGEIGERLRMGKEKRQLDVFLGAVNNYSFMGTTYSSYQTSGGGGGSNTGTASSTGNNNWVNVRTSLPLVDWTSVESAELLFSEILDPDTQNPILLDPDTIVCMPAKYHTARRIVSASEIDSIFPTYAGSGTSPSFTAPSPGNVIMRGANPLKTYNVITSNILYQRAKLIDSTNAKDYWFLVDSKRKPFVYVRNWDITVIPAPAESLPSFERDIVARWKASERGVAGVWDPRRAAFLKNA
jgi:hypothetical protein